MVHWSWPVIAQGVVTAVAGITVGYWLFARQRFTHAKDTAAVLVANLNGVHAILSSVASRDNTVDSAGRADTLLAARSLVDAYTAIMPSIGILGHEIVQRIGRIYSEINILVMDIEAVDYDFEAVVGRTQALSRSIRIKSMKNWFATNEKYVVQAESSALELSADICRKFGLTIETDTALFQGGGKDGSEVEGKQKGGT